MLYDKRWEKPEIKANTFSLGSLIAWLETQPGDKYYDATCSGSCMLYQWLLSLDPKMKEGPGDSYDYVVFGSSRDFSEFNNIIFDGAYTFGAALERARAALKSR